jgi:hypothetical protein
MEQRKHAPIKQLKEAAKEANRMLVERGIHTAESAIDRILGENKVVLPGIPAYLPHRWTLQESRRYMRDIVKLWVEKNKGNQKKQDNATAFFSFLVKELAALEKEAQKKVDAVPAIIKSMHDIKIPVHRVFSAWQLLETTQAITRFMVDSFAVSMVVKEHHTTTEFAEWFMSWTMQMDALWVKNERRDGEPILGKK